MQGEASESLWEVKAVSGLLIRNTEKRGQAEDRQVNDMWRRARAYLLVRHIGVFLQFQFAVAEELFASDSSACGFSLW